MRASRSLTRLVSHPGVKWFMQLGTLARGMVSSPAPRAPCQVRLTSNGRRGAGAEAIDSRPECNSIAAALYVRRALPTCDSHAYEQHLFDCRACLHHVEIWRAIARELRGRLAAVRS
jgi:hypothetical protein